MSYAWNENEQCNNGSVTWAANCTNLHIPDSSTYVYKTNVEFMKLGIIGHTLLAASGDEGTAGKVIMDKVLILPGNHGVYDDCKKQASLFPAASPYPSLPLAP
jgi:hypothetical protein